MKLSHTLAVMTLAASFATTAQTSDTLQDWMASHAVAVRSIDAKDEDFSDLEPLMTAIGSSRVVQMGEPSHGAGSAFAAKVRIIKFLHERMGFDVLVWESGLYDVRLAQAAMRSAEDPVTAAKRGILSVWSNAEEVKPLLEYVKASQVTTSPIDLAGMDMKPTAARTDELFLADLRSFVGALQDAPLRTTGATLVERIVTTYGQMRAPKKKEELKDFQKAVDDLLAAIRSHRAIFEQAHGAMEIAFFEHALAGLRGHGTSTYHRRRADRPKGAEANVLDFEEWNRRDALMASNLQWLINERYAGRKIIVWAHNAHIMNGYFAADWASVHTKAQPGGMKPTGAYIAEALKHDVYSIAVTTYEGEENWANGQMRGTILPAAAGSFESRLHALGKPCVFLDFRAAGGVRKHPMHTPQSLRISGYGKPTNDYGNDTVPDLTKAFDAVLFIDRMAPATRLPVAAP
jgi:erythromycin esterase